MLIAVEDGGGEFDVMHTAGRFDRRKRTSSLRPRQDGMDRNTVDGSAKVARAPGAASSAWRAIKLAPLASTAAWLADAKDRLDPTRQRRQATTLEGFDETNRCRLLSHRPCA